MTDPTLFGDTTGDGRRRATVSGGANSPSPHAPTTPDCSADRNRVARRHPVPLSEACATAHDRAEHDAVGRVASQVEALLVGLRSLGGELLEERLRLVGRCEAGLAAVRSETVAALARRDGGAKAAEAVRDRLRQSRGSAKRDVKLAGQLADLTGTTQALADGDITPQHARIIAEAAEHTDVDEAELLVAAASQPTDVFGNTVREHVNERSAGEDLQERRRRQRARRELSIKQQSDGMYKLFGLFDPVAGARIDAVLAATGKKLWHEEDPANRATLPQRYADALERLATVGGASGSQGATFVVVVVDYDAVTGELADARLLDGTPVVPDELVKLAVGAKVLPALFDTAGRPLWLGRATRDANAAQRIALAVRDRCCVGCGTRHHFCEPHHVVHWEHGGATDLDNLCLLCGDCHHKQVHAKGASIKTSANGRRTLRHPGRGGSPGRGRSRHGTVRGARSPAATAGATVNQPLLR